MSEIQIQANNQLCEENAKILLYSSKSFCEILYLRLTKKYILSHGVEEIIKKKYKKKCKRKPKGKLQLVGYYIRPELSDLSLANNRLLFRPVWVSESTSSYVEYVGAPILMQHNGNTSNNAPQPNPCNAHIIANVSPSNSYFRHNDLQFSELTVPNYDRAFISRYELFCLVQHSEFLGIVGARVSTGNIVPLDFVNENHMIHDCNKNYFTYRFIGFNSFNCEIRNNIKRKEIFLRRADYVDNQNSFDQSIPAEIWATPCPPRWI